MAVLSSSDRDVNPARSRAPMGASRRHENYTQAQIEQAVEAMMMRLSTGHGFDAAAARQVAQLIGPYVNDANTGIPPGGVLAGNQAFERMVLEKAAMLLSDTNDPATRAALARLAQQQNASASALLTPAQMAALGLPTGHAGSNRSSSASYDSISSSGANSDWNTPAGQDYMRHYAIEQGLSWAANIPDLLRLGPSAIRALADVNLNQESYQKLKDNAAFAAKDVVSFARFAKKKKIDANAGSDAISKVGEGLREEEKAKLRNGIVPYFERPDDKDAQERAHKAFEGVRHDHPEKGEAIDNAEKALRLKAEKTIKVEKKAEEKVTVRNDSLSELNSELADATPSPAGKTKDQHKKSEDKSPPNNAAITKVAAAAPAKNKNQTPKPVGV